jgi:hypothetical protein
MADKTGSQGQQIVEVAVGGLGVYGTPAGGVLTVQGGAMVNGEAVEIVVPPAPVFAQWLDFDSGNPAITGIWAALQIISNGSGIVVPRTPKIFKPLLAVAITAETTIWTPAAGKKFRLMGFVITQGTLTGNVTLRDNTAGTTILVIPASVVGNSLYVPLGNGILSAAANNVLTAQGAATETISGFVFGTEE